MLLVKPESGRRAYRWCAVGQRIVSGVELNPTGDSWHCPRETGGRDAVLGCLGYGRPKPVRADSRLTRGVGGVWQSQGLTPQRLVV